MHPGWLFRSSGGRTNPNTPRNADRSEGGAKKKNSENKKIKIGPRDVEIRVRSVRFTPRGGEKKVKGNFVTFRSEVTWACWLIFEEAGCGGWFLRKHGVLAGFYGARVCWLVFEQPWCAGWFLGPCCVGWFNENLRKSMKIFEIL